MTRAQALMAALPRPWSSLAGAAVQPSLSQTAAQRRNSPRSCGRSRLRRHRAITQARSIALFEEAGKVMQHPRCVNCHPAGERPLQSDQMRPHEPLVVRGKDGHGAPGLACSTCHGGANFDPARVPGDPQWHLAPASMAWEGKSLGADLQRSSRTRSATATATSPRILKHVADDSLVKWGWNPGAGRTPAPGTNEEFAALLKAWADTGAHCPAP